MRIWWRDVLMIAVFFVARKGDFLIVAARQSGVGFG
jgi:hypothetical protein